MATILINSASATAVRGPVVAGCKARWDLHTTHDSDAGDTGHGALSIRPQGRRSADVVAVTHSLPLLRHLRVAVHGFARRCTIEHCIHSRRRTGVTQVNLGWRDARTAV